MKPLFHKRGFTLIELSLVALIIIIMVSISMPLFRRTYYDIQLDEASYNIAKFMNYGRARAVAEGAKTRLNFDFNTGKYWLTVNNDPEKTDYFENIEGKLGRLYTVPAGIEITGEENHLTFYPNGRSDGFKLSLKNRNGREKTIDVAEETGEANIADIKE